MGFPRDWYSRALTAILIVLFLTSAITAALLITPVNANGPKTWHVDDDRAQYPDADFTKIQDAINAASDGDTIIVHAGVYNEHVVINKSLTLLGAQALSLIHI